VFIFTRREFLHVSGAVLLTSATLRAQQKRVRTLAGTGTAGFAADVSDALKTPLNNPYGLVIGPDGALYFCEVDTGRVRRLDLRGHTITTIASNGEKGYAGDGGPAAAASLAAPHELRFDRDGNLYVVERDNHIVRRIEARTRIISTVAGTAAAGFSGDGGPATRAQVRQPHSIAFNAAGHLLVCDIGNGRLRQVDLRTGIITTVAGTGTPGPTPDEGPIEGTPLNGPRSVDTDPAGNIYLVLREGNAVFRLDVAGGRLKRVAGTGASGYSGDGGSALAATFNGPKGIAYAPDQSLVVADTENHCIRRVDLKTGTIETILGTGQRGDGPDGDPRQCRMARPHGVCLHQGSLIVSDSENHRLRILD
jgi:sugar lactone lactonase YvrE